MGRVEEAQDANERGRELDSSGDTEGATREYERAMKLAPEWHAPHYNLGLVHKYAGRWEASLQANREAVRLNPADEASLWNLGIAATAVGDWAEARRAWRAYGIDIPDGDGPIDYPCGFNPIRLNPDADNTEVVWANRLDPARALLVSIPFPESGFRWSDLVINDGAPNGYRMLGDEEVPVFDCLGLLEASPFSTFVAELEVHGDSPPEEALAEFAQRRGLAAENWTRNTRVLCKACSEGRPHAEHDHVPERSDGKSRVGIAARDRSEAEDLLAEWTARIPTVEVHSIELRLQA